MNITDDIRKNILAILKKAQNINILDKKEQTLISLFEDPVALNVGYNAHLNKFSKGGPRLEAEHLKSLIHRGKLFFDFNNNVDEDKRWYKENNKKWDDNYSYNKVDTIKGDDDWDLGADEGDMFFIIENDAREVDYCRFDIRETIYVDETHIDVIDRGWHNGIKRRLAIL